MRARIYKNALWERITSMPDENDFSMLDSRGEQAQLAFHAEHSWRKEREWLNQLLMLNRSRMREGATQLSVSSWIVPEEKRSGSTNNEASAGDPF